MYATYRTKLLSATEEIELSELIRTGTEAQEELLAGTPDPQRQKQLRQAVERGREAEQRLIEANLRLVHYFAQRFGTGQDLEDIIQEGMIGLIQAARRFDGRKGFRFSTYATLWVRKYLRAGMYATRLVRLPPSTWEIVRNLQQEDEEPDGSEGMLRALRVFANDVVSLNSPVQEGDTELEDYQASTDPLDDVEDMVEQIIERQEAPKLVNELLAFLDSQEREVLMGTEGLRGGEPMSASALAPKLGMSPKRAQVLHRQSKAKLGHPMVITNAQRNTKHRQQAKHRPLVALG